MSASADMSWQAEALCRLPGVDAAAFFPDRGGDNGYAAKKVCARCPVRAECLAESIDRHEDQSIQGGAGEGLRRLLRRLQRASTHPTAAAALHADNCTCSYCAAVRVHFERLDVFAATGVMPRGAQPTFGPGATHGVAATAAKGCKCLPCRFAAAVRTSNSNPNNRRSAP